MPVFGGIEVEPVLQVGDKTRIDATKTFASKGEAAITKVEIEPEASAGYIEVTGSSARDWFLDWQYATAGTKTVSVKVTRGLNPPDTFTKQLSVITAATDKLWSTDADLQTHEPEILKYVRAGRSTFLDYHRSAQTNILNWLDAIRVTKKDGSRITKDDVTLTEEVNRISLYWSLMLIFSGLSNKPDDQFAVKARDYAAKLKLEKDRNVFRVDQDGDGDTDADDGPGEDMRSGRLIRG